MSVGNNPGVPGCMKVVSDRCLRVHQGVSMISSIEGVEIGGDAEDAVDITEAIERLEPEVVVMDVRRE